MQSFEQVEREFEFFLEAPNGKYLWIGPFNHNLEEAPVRIEKFKKALKGVEFKHFQKESNAQVSPFEFDLDQEQPFEDPQHEEFYQIIKFGTDEDMSRFESRYILTPNQAENIISQKEQELKHIQDIFKVEQEEKKHQNDEKDIKEEFQKLQVIITKEKNLIEDQIHELQQKYQQLNNELDHARSDMYTKLKNLETGREIKRQKKTDGLYCGRCNRAL